MECSWLQKVIERQQFFQYPPGMNQQLPQDNNSQSHGKAKHIRKGRKGHSRTDPFRKKQTSYSYILAKKTIDHRNNSKSQYCLGDQGSSSWKQAVTPWLEFDPSATQQCATYISEQFPVLKSIDELFSISSIQCLESQPSFRPVQRYSKICSLVTGPEATSVFLSKQSSIALTLSPNDEACEGSLRLGMMISESECQLVEKRSKFMEKLKTNQEKYDSSLGRMSQVSKELAFTYRTYLQARKDTQTILHSLSSKVADNFHFNFLSQDTKQRYARLLLGKNLRHTFGSLELDRLNYFKMRQYVESDRIHDYENITSFEQFLGFVNRRKPKRGRKLTLSTACSVCLSDYHEMSNPLVTCEKCHLRAHRLCYSFDQMKCGSCTYQKLQRKVKEVMSWCFICRKAGLMVVKLSQAHYAHGFCLLMHGYWQCGGSGTRRSHGSTLSLAKQSYSPLENQCRQLVKAVQYQSPFEKQISMSSTSLQQNSKHQKGYSSDISECNQSIEADLQPSEVENIGHLEEQAQKQQWKFSAFDLEKNAAQRSHQGCKACGQSFFKDCFLSCQLCGQKYHALCSFFSGFELTLQEGEFTGGSQNLPRLNCCNQSSTVIGQNRRFKLNYNRCVFKMLPGDLQPSSQQSIWQQ